MATDLETLRIKLEADIGDLKVGLAQAQSSLKGIDDNVKVADSGMKKFGSTLKNLAGTIGVAFAGTQMVQFAKDTVMAASDMQESISKVSVVFGEGAEKVFEWGKTAAESMGISNQAALEAAGTYGNLFQAFGLGQGESQKMSMSLVQLASDMASFNNTSIDDAILALRSGLSGETEPLKRFGVALSDVRLKTEAMSMGLIKSTSEALTPAAKSQAAYALIMKDTALAQGDYARTADGTANTMKTLQAKMADAKVALGDALLPAFRALLAVLNLAVPMLKKLGEFFKNNQDEIKAFAIVLMAGATAWGVYTLAVKRAEIAQKLLNAAQKVNPIGVIVTAVALLVAALVKAYKNVDWFREAVNKFAKFALTAFASIIPMVGKIGEALLKLFLTPLKTVLAALSKLPGVGKYAKAGLDILNKGLDGVSDFADKASKKAKELAANLDKVNKEGEKAKKNAPDANVRTKGTTIDPNKVKEAAAAEKQRVKDVESNQKKLAKLYEDVEKVKKDAAKKTADAQKDLEKARANAYERYEERKADLTKRYNETVADAEMRRDKAVTKAKADNVKELAAISREYRERTEQIEKQYAERRETLQKAATKKLADLEESYQKKVTDLREKAAEKSADIIAKGAEKQANILQQSIDRLRSAFASGAGFSITDMFKEGGTTGGLLDKLKTQLAGVRNLQANAAKLASQGYSQTFIEQVVKAGPDIGNKMAEAIASASPEQTAELQALYSNLEELTNNGLNTLAATMNAGGNLATEELRKAYQQVTIDVQNALAEVNSDLQASLADAASEYSKSVTEVNAVLLEGLAEAKETYDEAMAEAAKTRDEKMAEAMAKLEEALAEADEALKEAIAEAQKNLAEGLIEAEKDLIDALTDAQEAFEEKIAEIHASMTEKLNDLKTQIMATLALLAQLGAWGGGGGGSSAGGVASRPSDYSVLSKGKTDAEKIDEATTVANKVVGDTNITINGVNLTDPQGTAQNIVTLIKYGQTVQVASTNMSGIQTTGLNAARNGIVRVAE